MMRCVAPNAYGAGSLGTATGRVAVPPTTKETDAMVPLGSEYATVPLTTGTVDVAPLVCFTVIDAASSGAIPDTPPAPIPKLPSLVAAPTGAQSSLATFDTTATAHTSSSIEPGTR